MNPLIDGINRVGKDTKKLRKNIRYPQRYRNDKDFYPTPSYVTEELFKREKFYGVVLEPASGTGAMSKIIEKYNHCISQDIIENPYGTGKKDYLKETKQYDNVITNPPYKFAEEFVIKSKQIARKKFALLLNITFLEGKKRYTILIDKKYPLKKVIVFSKRIKFVQNAGSMIGSAWFIWDKQYSGEPTIEWVLNE